MMYMWHKYEWFAIHIFIDGTRNLCYKFHASGLGKELTRDCLSDELDKERKPSVPMKPTSIRPEMGKHLGEITTMDRVI